MLVADPEAGPGNIPQSALAAPKDDSRAMGVGDSLLASTLIPAFSGNFTRNRALYGKIAKITLHHTAGVMTVESLGRLWQIPDRRGSSHYGVSGSNIGQYVLEKDVAWTNSDWNANCRAVTIEVSNSAGSPQWPVLESSVETTIRLIPDIAKRNNLYKLEVGKNSTFHSMYTSTLCPGPYLRERLQIIADKSNKINEESNDIMPMSTQPVRMWIGPVSSGGASIMINLINGLGITCEKQTNSMLHTGFVSSGDQITILSKALELKLGFGPLCRDGSGVSQEKY